MHPYAVLRPVAGLAHRQSPLRRIASGSLECAVPPGTVLPSGPPAFASLPSRSIPAEPLARRGVSASALRQTLASHRRIPPGRVRLSCSRVNSCAPQIHTRACANTSTQTSHREFPSAWLRASLPLVRPAARHAVRVSPSSARDCTWLWKPVVASSSLWSINKKPVAAHLSSHHGIFLVVLFRAPCLGIVSQTLSDASLRHCSSVPTAKSACSWSIISGGDRRIEFSPAPRTSSPFWNAASTMAFRKSAAFSLVR